MTSKVPPGDHDSPGWESTYLAHAGRLIRLATVLVGPTDAADLVAETVQRVVHSQGWSRADDQPAFLTRSLVNASASHHRSTGRRRRLERRVARPESRPSFDAGDTLHVRAALARLSPQQRAIVYLTYWEDLAIPTVADRLGVSEGTIRRQLARSKTRLREVLQ